MWKWEQIRDFSVENEIIYFIHKILAQYSYDDASCSNWNSIVHSVYYTFCISIKCISTSISLNIQE